MSKYWDVVFPVGIGLAILVILAGMVYAVWYEHRYPCKRWRSYDCQSIICVPSGVTTVCYPVDSTCKECVERWPERPPE